MFDARQLLRKFRCAIGHQLDHSCCPGRKWLNLDYQALPLLALLHRPSALIFCSPSPIITVASWKLSRCRHAVRSVSYSETLFFTHASRWIDYHIDGWLLEIQTCGDASIRASETNTESGRRSWRYDNSGKCT